MSDVDNLLAARGLTFTETLRDAGHSRTVGARTADGTAVIVKIRTGDEGYLRACHDTERAVYAALTDQPPLGVRTARLIDSDDHTITLERLPGGPLGGARYPGRLSKRAIGHVLDALDVLHGWQPTADLPRWPRTRALDYLRAAEGSPLTSDDRDLAEQLAAAVTGLRFEHGDLLPGNVLADGDSVALIDFQAAGWHPPGTDWALLDLLWSPANPWLRPLLHRRATTEAVHTGYALALLVHAAHEHHLHRVLFAAGEYERRRALLDANLAHARLHARAAYRRRSVRHQPGTH